MPERTAAKSSSTGDLRAFEPEQQLEETRRLLAARSEQLTAAWDNLRKRDEELATAWAALEAREQEMNDAWAIVAERNRQLEDIWAKLAERDQQLEQAWATISERDQQLEQAWATISERDQQLEQAAAAISERDQQLEQAAATVADRDQEIERLRQSVSEEGAKLTADEELVRTLQHFADLGQVHRRSLEDIQSSLAYKMLVRVVWPISRALLPWRVRHAAKQGLRWLRAKQPVAGQPATDDLLCGIDTDLAQTVAVGKGTALVLTGWCYHPRRRIRRLSVLLDGAPAGVANYGIVRPEVLRDQAPRIDQRGFSLNSGFVAVVRLHSIEQPRRASITLRARLAYGRSVDLAIGSVSLQPGQDETPSESAEPFDTDGCPGDGPRVAICMATYNPPAELFRKQIESICSQSHQNWFCIVNDDCSSASSYAHMEQVTGHDPRFRLYRNASRKGFYNNFETALARVPPDAEFVALCDQDDEWYPDKLRACLERFEQDTMLVYTDQDIVAEDGALRSHTYWVNRRNNYTDFKTLLFANTVTGAASVFRASLLDDILPFPARVGDSFHDHWIACVAMVRGRLDYIDKAMYAYTQHARNVIGHYEDAQAWRLIPGWSRLRRWLTAPSAAKAMLRDELWSKRAVYFNDVLRLVVIASTLRLRIPTMPASKKRAVDRFASFDRSLVNIVKEALWYEILRRPTVGAELYCLRGAVANRLLNLYYRARSKAIYRHHVALLSAPSQPAALAAASSPTIASPANPQADLLAGIEVVREKIAPLNLEVSTQAPRRVNLIVPSIDFRYLFGGYIGKLNLALRLRQHGYEVRLVIVDWCDYNPSAWKREIKQYEELANFFDEVELAYTFDRSVPLQVHPADAFIATTWWTAHIANQAVTDLGSGPFVYLIQEYEPMTFPMGSFYALAEETYTFPHYALFSTELLRDYFRRNRIGVFGGDGARGEERSIAFQNAIHAFDVSEQALRERTTRKLLFYARPEPHAARNMFETGILGLQEAIRRGVLDGSKWELHGIGTVGAMASLQVAPGYEMKLLPRVSLAEYLELLPAYDIGLSLMLTPHPSLVPLEMAGAGMLTVTNTYANKTKERLCEISRNLIAVPPTISGVAAGLATAASEVNDISRRVEGSRVAWATTWEQALGGNVLETLLDFVGGRGRAERMVGESRLSN